MVFLALMAQGPWLMGQTGGGDMSGVAMSLLGIVAILLVSVLIIAGGGLLALRANELGIANKGQYRIIPSFAEIFGRKSKTQDGQKIHCLKQGFDIKLAGQAERVIEPLNVTYFAVQPPNFHGLSPIPKVVPEIGDSVAAGDVLFYDKTKPDIVYVSPVSGEIVEVRRGAKRAITHVIIKASGKQSYKKLNVPTVSKASRLELIDFLLQSGYWPIIRQRPYNIMASVTTIPRDIFISTFDTAPLAPDNNFVVETDGDAFQVGVSILRKITNGKVHLGLNGAAGSQPSTIFTDCPGVEKHWFNGAHPAGCVGIQIHHIAPIKSGDVVWTLGVQDVMMLGRLFRDGRYDATQIVASTGSALNASRYYQTYRGACVGEIVPDAAGDDNLRIISGDVLTGAQKSKDDFIDIHDDQVTVIQEGRQFELFGWLAPLKFRPSISRTFPGFILRDIEYKGETNTHGEERAFVITGLYERVLPMNIYPQHLLKAVMANDLEKMEGLGIQEVVEEDLALCEFVCPSKTPVQQVLRQGMNAMIEQG